MRAQDALRWRSPILGLRHSPAAPLAAERVTAATARRRPKAVARWQRRQRGAPPAAVRSASQHGRAHSSTSGRAAERPAGREGKGKAEAVTPRLRPRKRHHGPSSRYVRRTYRRAVRLRGLEPLCACAVPRGCFHSSRHQQGERRARPCVPCGRVLSGGSAAMSVPEVEAHVSQKYEIKRRLGKGVSALRGRGSGPAGPPSAGPPSAGPPSAGPPSAACRSLPQAADLSCV